MRNTTVTMPIDEFEEMRSDSNSFRELREKIAACFSYKYLPGNHCGRCDRQYNCADCKKRAWQKPPENRLTVDVANLICVCKEYALFGKDVETEIDEMTLKVLNEGEIK